MKTYRVFTRSYKWNKGRASVQNKQHTIQAADILAACDAAKQKHRGAEVCCAWYI